MFLAGRVIRETIRVERMDNLEPIYDRLGHAVGYLSPADGRYLIYATDQQTVRAQITDGWIRTAGTDTHIGYMYGGWFTDPNGYPVAFLPLADKGPGNQGPAVPAIPDAPAVRNAPFPFWGWKPLEIFPMNSWSDLPWDQFLNT